MTDPTPEPFSIQNLQDRNADPFSTTNEETGTQSELVHIRIQQRSGRKTLTTVQGLNPEYDKKKILKACKKEFACNATIVEHKEYGEVIQFQGDQRKSFYEFLIKMQIAGKDAVKVHGF